MCHLKQYGLVTVEREKDHSRRQQANEGDDDSTLLWLGVEECGNAVDEKRCEEWALAINDDRKTSQWPEMDKQWGVQNACTVERVQKSKKRGVGDGRLW